MKNLSFAVFVATAILWVTGCSSGSTSSTTAGNTSNAGDTDTKDAQEIISFNNALIALDDRNDSYLQEVRSNLEKIVSLVQSPGTPNYINEPFEQPIPTTPGEDPNKVPASLSAAEQEFFKTNVAAVNEVYSQIKTNYKSLYDYMQAEDYKDDHYEKSNKLLPLMDSLWVKYYNMEDVLIKRLKIVGDGAERTLLKDHPLKEFIYALKDDKKAVADLNDLLDNAATNYKVSESAVEAAYSKLEAQYTQHAAMQLPENQGYGNQKEAWRRFYTTLDAYLVDLRKIMRDAASSGHLEESDLEHVNKEQDTFRIYYNDFVG